ncbi:hypothetical protein L218DRAFT_1071959 [Marasmius fiardii PR-910]|nr:hypothetical protein L218DRAFT_1071959 [Marasmius fiardii PR-910]
MVSCPTLLEKDPPLDTVNLNELVLQQAELDRWETLKFSFDMEEEKGQNGASQGDHAQGSQRAPSSSQSQNSQPRVPSASNISDAVLLAQFAANAGAVPSQPSTMNPYSALLNYFQAQGVNPAALPPAVNPANLPSSSTSPNAYQHTFGPAYAAPLFNPWQQQASNSNPFHSPRSPTAGFLPGTMPFPGPAPFGMWQQEHEQSWHHLPPGGPLPSGSSSPIPSSPASPSHPPVDDDAVSAIAEDKRRRNTAASARFRIKKKMRNMNLEKTVSELSGRADTLEREAADLRRENGWLKEIVMLKGSRMAGIDISPHTIPNLGEGSSAAQANRPGPANPRSKDREEPESDEDSSDDYLPEGKGKAKAKSKKEKRK